MVPPGFVARKRRCSGHLLTLLLAQAAQQLFQVDGVKSASAAQVEAVIFVVIVARWTTEGVGYPTPLRPYGRRYDGWAAHAPSAASVKARWCTRAMRSASVTSWLLHGSSSSSDDAHDSRGGMLARARRYAQGGARQVGAC